MYRYKRQCIIGSLLLLGLSGCSTTSAPAPAAPSATATTTAIDTSKIKASIDTIMASYLQGSAASGCSVAVVYPDSAGKEQTLYLNYGTLSKDSKTPTSQTTIYEVGSISKVFTGELLAVDVGLGVMHLDDPVQQYLPSTVHVPTYQGQSITLRELATHTSGLPRTLPNPTPHEENGVPVSGYASAADVFKFLNAYHLTRAPGSQWEYSNLANAVLGIAEEQVGKETYENLVLKNIITPLALPDTRVTLTAEQQSRLALGYGANGMRAPLSTTAGEMLAAGGVRSTTQDMAAFIIDNIDPSKTPLAAALGLALQQAGKGGSPTSAMGLGWIISKPATPQEEFNKPGSTAGYSSFIALSQRTRTGFAVLCNATDVNTTAVPKLSQAVNGFQTEVDPNQ
jgi:serine-type D-Ala-D-Ala carboxypeptidase/endopeptidase